VGAYFYVMTSESVAEKPRPDNQFPVCGARVIRPCCSASTGRRGGLFGAFRKAVKTVHADMTDVFLPLEKTNLLR